MAITIDETGIKIDGVLKVDINTAVQLANKANINGSSSQRFKVADAINNNEAINKEQLLAEIEAIGGAGSDLDADKVRGLPADFSSSKNTNGYQKLPSGLIIQWGISDEVYANNEVTVIFPITFPNNVFTVTATRDTVANDDSWSNVRDLTESGFIARAEFNGTGGTSYGYTRWIAIGY